MGKSTRLVRAVCVLGMAACGYPPLPVADAPPDGSHVALTWQLATTSSTGVPSPALEYPPFAPGTAPPIRIATLDGPFTPASYSSDPQTPGWILVPREYFEPAPGTSTIRPWRLEYTLGGVPHEVQWTPDDKVGHLVVPMVGRLDRPTVPVGSGYNVTLTNFTFPTTGPVHNPSVLTTGLWTAGHTAPPTGMTVDYAFASATPLSGPGGSPSTTPSDRGFLVDYVSNPDGNGIQCNVAVGSASLGTLALTAGTHTAQSATWDTLRQRVTSELPDVDILQRLTTALGKLNTAVSALGSRLLLGSIPSTSFPGLTGNAVDLLLPVPVMQTLLLCPVGPGAPGPTDPNTIPATAQPSMLGDFPTAVHVQLVEPRTVAAFPGVILYSGIETVVALSAGGVFKLPFPAAMPTQITLTTPAGTKLDLVDSTDQIVIGPTAGRFTLDFVPEAGVGLRADYHDVYLHRINGTTLTTERIYTVTVPEVVIDGSVLIGGADYVLEIRSYAGHVMAPHGDFAPVDYPYGGAVVSTRTFKTS